MEQNVKNETISCYYMNDNEKVFSEIKFRLGTCFVLIHKDNNKQLNENLNSLVCYNLENAPFLLYKTQYYNDFGLEQSFYFENMITGFRKAEDIKQLKFKKIRFSFPYINAFFWGIDDINSFDETNPDRIFLEYEKTIGNFKYKLNSNFSIKLEHGFSCGGGNFCFGDSKMSLEKHIIVTSKKMETLDKFLEVIRALISLFSFSLKRKVIISELWSNSNENSSKNKLQIKTFQFKIFDTDYEKEIYMFKTLINYKYVNKNLGKIFKKYFELHQKEYRCFQVVIGLYLRNQDAPSEIHPQIEFLTYTQALDAFICAQEYNDKKEISNEYKEAIEQIKKDYSAIPQLKELAPKTEYSFVEKIVNCIKNENIEQIFNFKYLENNRIKLLSDIQKVRNYFTHYNISEKKLDGIDLYELKNNTKILLEVLILSALGVPLEVIRGIQSHNCYELTKWEHPYFNILKPKYRTTYPQSNYLGGIHFYENNEFKEFDFYYINIDDKNVKLICKYGKESKKKITKIIPKKINQKTKASLNKPLNICYDRYLEKI